MAWLEASVRVAPEAAEAVAEVLSRYAPRGVAIDLGTESENATSPVTVKAYLEMNDEVETRRQKIEEALWHLRHIWDVVPEPIFQTIEDQDWTAGWKETIPVLHIGTHVVIKPSWRDYEPAEGEIVLEMDPGLAFGTGLHPTTQLCAEALIDLYQPPMRVLDLGTGTGILALIAAKLGAQEVLAVDNNIDAVAVTRRNSRANAVAQHIRPLHGSLDVVNGRHDLVLANILAPIIIEMAQAGLATRVRTDGYLIASGILKEQAGEVKAALEAHQLRITEQREQGDWVVLIARKTRQ